MVKVTLLLADHAQAVGGKLYICGGGWAVTGPEPCPFALAMDIKVPWHMINEEQAFVLDLVDSDGQAFMVETPDGEQPFRIEGGFQVAPAPGLKPGSELGAVMAINLPPQPFVPGAQYEWRLAINGKSHESWRWPFSVRTVPVQQAA
jgi:hypothetical protein